MTVVVMVLFVRLVREELTDEVGDEGWNLPLVFDVPATVFVGVEDE